MVNYSDALRFIPTDDRYASLSAHDLKIIRKNMIEQGGYNKYQLALVQFWIMKKEDRLSSIGIK